VFNLAFDHLAFADVPYYAIERLGEANTTPFADDQIIRLVAVVTDNPVDGVGVDKNVDITNTMSTDGIINWNYKVGS
jgi:hypothetical protein